MVARDGSVGVECGVVGDFVLARLLTPGAHASITIEGEEDRLPALESGEQKALVPSVLGEKGQVLRNRRITWSSTIPSVAAVDSAGLVVASYVVGIAVEETTISASSEGQIATLRVAVFPSDPAKAEGFASLTLAPGDSVRFVPVVKDAAGNILPGRSVAYESSDPLIARVDGDVHCLIGGDAHGERVRNWAGGGVSDRDSSDRGCTRSSGCSCVQLRDRAPAVGDRRGAASGAVPERLQCVLQFRPAERDGTGAADLFWGVIG